MADTLKSFLVSIGFDVDTSSKTRADSAVQDSEDKATRATTRASEKRRKVDAQESADRERMAKQTSKEVDATRKREDREEAKRDAARKKVDREGEERRRKTLKETIENVSKVEDAIKAVAGATIGSKLWGAVTGTAAAYSNLSMQAQRTGAAPSVIARTMYALTQMGVGRGEAESSFNGFVKALQTEPGLKSVLAGNGVKVKNADGSDRDPGEIFEDLGPYFAKLRPNVALAQAGHLGIGQDTMLSLEKKAEFDKQRSAFDKIQGAFGLDPEKASKEGREFTAAYDKVAADLHATKDAILADFFGPLTKALTTLSEQMEKHPEVVKAFGEAFTVLAGLLTLKAIPPLLRLTGLLTGLTTFAMPAWLGTLLGVGGVVAASAATDAAVANEKKPSLVKGWDDEAGGLPASTAGAGGVLKRGYGWAKRKLGFGGGGDDAPAQDSSLPPGRPGTYRPAHDLSEADLSNKVVNKIAGEARNTQTSTDAVINNMMNRVGTNTYGPGGNLEQVATARNSKGEPQYAGLSVADAKRAAFIRERIKAIASGSVPDNTNGSNEYRASYYYGRWTQHHLDAPVIGGNRFAYNPKGGRGPYGPYDKPHLDSPLPTKAPPLANAPNPYGSLAPMTPGKPQGLVGGGYLAAGLGPDGKPVTLGGTTNNTRGDTSFHQTNNINVHGDNSHEAVADSVKATARRGGQDYIRNIEGSSQ